MTIVLTHGWNSDPTVWAQSMASNMVAKGVSANVLAYDWRYAAASPYPPEENTPAEGVLLGQSLQTELGANYSHPIHFIGHSLGTIVNASAANYLHGDQTAQQGASPTPWTNAPIHVTLLDEAELASLAGTVGVEGFFDGLTVRLINLGVPLASPPSGASQGWKSPIPIHTTWADNYISKFGFYHSDAVNVRLDKATFFISGAAAQHAYSYQWYGMSVTNPADCVLGFQRSSEARAANLSVYAYPFDAGAINLR
jgi:pimeloyl-ACP methyl ester carboxylesterase